MASEAKWFEAATALQEYMVSIRRDLHRHPELAFREERTSGIVAKEMEAIGLDVKRCGATGVIGELKGAGDGPVVAIRADMDALPFDEERESEYRSQVAGAAHLCGHDAHVAMLLGVAKLLKREQATLPGYVRFLAEPAEESKGGKEISGAEHMISCGALSNPKPIAILGVHVFPEFSTGKVALRSGTIMTGHSRFTVQIHGQEAHAATPHLAVDAWRLATEIGQALLALSDSLLPPEEVCLINIGTAQVGHAYNLIPGSATLVGSMRTSQESARELIGERLAAVARGIATTHGAECVLDFDAFTFPATVNDAKVTGMVRQVALQCCGEDAVVDMPIPRLTGETFCHYLNTVPGCYFILGTGNASKDTLYSSHHPRFDIDEEAMPYGAAVLAASAVRILSQAR